MGCREFLIGIVLLALACPLQKASPTGFSDQAAQAQISQPPVLAPEFPGFTVNVTFSESAKKKLVESKETVIVAGYLSGNPKKGALKRYVSEIGDVSLGTIEAEIAPGEIAKFGEVKLKEDARKQTDGADPQLLINVYSGRKSTQDNLLDCGIYEGSLESVQGKSIPIACKLIGE